jgi:fucose 4-O-acetylase-like acetyltransferase
LKFLEVSLAMSLMSGMFCSLTLSQRRQTLSMRPWASIMTILTSTHTPQLSRMKSLKRVTTCHFRQ